MKKLLITLLSALSLTSVAQELKTVAVLDPICRDNSVNPFFQQMVRGAMESAVTASVEYEAYDRSAFDQIQKEQAFQRTGAVSDSQIKQMGEMAGVDYVLVSEVSAYDGYLSAVVKILNVTTGKYDNSKNGLMKLEPETVSTKCDELALSLFGASNNSSRTTAGSSAPTISISQNNLELSEDVYDFGFIHEEGGRVSHTFNLPMRFSDISGIRASCGCLVPTWEVDPSNSERTLVYATYNPKGRPGKFHKTITITLVNGIVQKLFVKGEVISQQK